MSEGTKIPLEQAKQIAKELIIDFAGGICKKATVAGSIRRGKEMIGDIEIVAIANPYETGIFESGLAKVVNQWQKVKGEMEYGKTKYTQRILSSGRSEEHTSELQ